MQQLDVAFIVPTLFSNQDYLIECLESISIQKVNQLSVSLVLVCNANQNKTQEIRTIINEKIKFPFKISYLILGNNQGFATAVNAGIKSIDAKNYALINDDVVLDKDWLLEIINCQSKSNSQMIASQILQFDSKEVDSLGFSYLFRGKAPVLNSRVKNNYKNFDDYWLNNKNLFPSNDKNFFKEPFGPDAAACLISNELFKQIGYFDESFFAYLEDVDLALRARMTGMSCILCQKAIAYHHKHETSKQMGKFKQKQDVKNWWRIIMKYPVNIKLRYFFLIFCERIKNLKGLIIL